MREICVNSDASNLVSRYIQILTNLQHVSWEGGSTILQHTHKLEYCMSGLHVSYDGWNLWAAVKLHGRLASTRLQCKFVQIKGSGIFSNKREGSGLPPKLVKSAHLLLQTSGFTSIVLKALCPHTWHSKFFQKHQVKDITSPFTLWYLHGNSIWCGCCNALSMSWCLQLVWCAIFFQRLTPPYAVQYFIYLLPHSILVVADLDVSRHILCI
jgi:hypothetical protein